MKFRKCFMFAALAILFMSSAAIAQPDTLWTQTYGGSSNDWGRSVQQTQDGGYIIAGYTYSYGAGLTDAYLVKTDASGNEQWYQTYGDSGFNQGYSVQQTQDGGYIITGYTWSYGAGGSDVYLIKTDVQGTEEWTQTFGGNGWDHGRSVRQTTDGGYIVAGDTDSYGAGVYDVYLIKTDESGDTLWTRTYGGIGDDYCRSVQQTDDGDYIIAGYTESYGPGTYAAYLIKTDASGTELWTQTYGGAGWDHSYDVQQTDDGGYIIAGDTQSYGAGSYDIYLIKTDASGTEEWYQTYGGIHNDKGESVQQTTDGGYIIAGYTWSYGVGAYDVYLIKTDESGDTLWTQTYGGNLSELGYSVQQTTDGGYIIAGYTWSYGAGFNDVYLIRLDAETQGIDEEELSILPIEYALHQNYPNPFNPMTTLSYALPEAARVKLRIFDVNGRQISDLANGWREAGMHEVTFDATDLASGVYVYRLDAGAFTASGKMVLMK